MLFANNNECPDGYLKWVALSTLSTLVGRRFWLDQGLITLHPNLYVILVGPPGCKKTTAMDMGKGIVRQTGKIVITATSATKESLCKDMTPDDSPYRRVFTRKDTNKVEEYSQAAIFATELTHFINVNPLGWIEFLTTIYDQAVYEVSTKGKGKDYIPGPYITLLGCMTPELTGQFVKASIISGGFSSRTIFVWADPSNKRVPFPELPPENREALKRCVAWGQELQKHSGAFVFAPGARAWYDQWYNKHKDMEQLSMQRCMVPFYARKPMMVLKIAMLLALSENLNCQVTNEFMELADIFLDEVAKDMPKVFTGAGENLAAGIAADIEQTLMSMGKPVKYKALFEMYYDKCARKEFDEILDALVTQDRCRVWDQDDHAATGAVFTCKYVAPVHVYEDHKQQLAAKRLIQEKT